MLNVLVVEDDFAVRKLTSIMLKNAGFTPVACATAAAAVAQIKNEVISLALIDVMLPDTDGLSLVKLLRGINSDLPVIMVTAKGLPADKRAGFYAGADDYLVKPVDEEELILRIRALLRPEGRNNQPEHRHEPQNGKDRKKRVERHGRNTAADACIFHWN